MDFTSAIVHGTVSLSQSPTDRKALAAQFADLKNRGGGPSTVDVYVDEAGADPQRRAVQLPKVAVQVGKSLSEGLAPAFGTERLERMQTSTPEAEYARLQVIESVKFQASLMRFSMTTKAIELSVKSFQTLFKIQG